MADWFSVLGKKNDMKLDPLRSYAQLSIMKWTEATEMGEDAIYAFSVAPCSKLDEERQRNAASTGQN